MFRIIRIGYTGDVASRTFDIIISVSILLNLFIIFFETFDISAGCLSVLNVIELITVVIFTVEYILRLITADLLYPDRTRTGAVIAFVFSLYGIIDLLSFLPYWLAFVFPAARIPAGVVAFRMLRVVRILRLFRINRYYDAFNVITDVLKEKKKQIASALFIILMLVMGASIIMYDLEHDAQPEEFKNAFSGIWWAVSTLLTVGYGDIYPITPAGRFVGIILAFLGVGIVAIPTGIISAGFVQQYTRIKDIDGTTDEHPLGSFSVPVTTGHEWVRKSPDSLRLPQGVSVLGIIRKNEVKTAGDTIICEGDRVLLSSLNPDDSDTVTGEIFINEKSSWIDETVAELEAGLGVKPLMIIRENKSFIPAPSSVIKSLDVIIVCDVDTGGVTE
ncbi:MAG: ion transporter [Lachnospiraceae bacterium]|nr:ion transporter [Lachnospiraceae bacterium]